MKAEILTVGDELLRGEIVDSNKSFLSERLLSLDIETRWHASMGDDPGDMTERPPSNPLQTRDRSSGRSLPVNREPPGGVRSGAGSWLPRRSRTCCTNGVTRCESCPGRARRTTTVGGQDQDRP